MNTNAKSSVKESEMVACLKCGTLNEMRFGVCYRCGSILSNQSHSEAQSVFASELPDWDIEPPYVVVRRKRKK